MNSKLRCLIVESVDSRADLFISFFLTSPFFRRRRLSFHVVRSADFKKWRRESLKPRRTRRKRRKRTEMTIAVMPTSDHMHDALNERSDQPSRR